MRELLLRSARAARTMMPGSQCANSPSAATPQVGLDSPPRQVEKSLRRSHGILNSVTRTSGRVYGDSREFISENRACEEFRIGAGTLKKARQNNRVPFLHFNDETARDENGVLPDEVEAEWVFAEDKYFEQVTVAKQSGGLQEQTRYLYHRRVAKEVAKILQKQRECGEKGHLYTAGLGFTYFLRVLERTEAKLQKAEKEVDALGLLLPKEHADGRSASDVRDRLSLATISRVEACKLLDISESELEEHISGTRIQESKGGFRRRDLVALGSLLGKIHVVEYWKVDAMEDYRSHYENETLARVEVFGHHIGARQTLAEQEMEALHGEDVGSTIETYFKVQHRLVHRSEFEDYLMMNVGLWYSEVEELLDILGL